MLYDPVRYEYRGKFAQSRFEKNCLAEYAEVFSTVCVDAAYYKFPERASLEPLVSQVPADFLFTFKVTDEITIKRFSNLPRFGPRAGHANEHFLDADLFRSSFLRPCEDFKQNVGLLIFEFSRFYPSDFERGREFVEALDVFLGQLPREWSYGVEIRNPNFLRPEYFEVLARHGVTHVYNNWAEMPAVGQQMQIADSRTTPSLVAARFLLKPGREYQAAVELFSPYKEIKDVDKEAREAGTKLMASADGKAKAFIYVNNRLEGNALVTIEAMIDPLERKPTPLPQLPCPEAA